MFSSLKSNRRGRLIARFVAAASVLSALALHIPNTAQAQEGDRTTRVCSSDGGRIFCEADTRGGVRLFRQIGEARCREGYSWGYTEQGIWVDRGCQAEFLVGNESSWGGYANGGRWFARIEPGTLITVRTNEYIDSDRADGRVFTGAVDQDVVGTNGRLAIPRGAPVELIVRVARDNDLILDLDSVSVNGQRYALRTDTNRIEADRRDGVGRNRRTGEYVGGGALLGSIIGAIAGGGKGAAIGAAAGAAAGAGGQVLTRGREVRIPRESLLTFRLEQPIEMGVADAGYDRDGRHYHDYYRNDRGR